MNLKDQLIKLGSDNPSLQKHIRPVLDRLSQKKTSRSKRLSMNVDEFMEKARDIQAKLTRQFPPHASWKLDEQGALGDESVFLEAILEDGKIIVELVLAEDEISCTIRFFPDKWKRSESEILWQGDVTTKRPKYVARLAQMNLLEFRDDVLGKK
jgi:hypothetical protein